MKIACLAAALLAFAGAAAAQPGGWSVHKDKAQRCQISVPGDWTTDKFGSFLSSPDHKNTAVVHGLEPNGNYQTAVETAKKLFKDVKVVEESPSRTMFTYAHTNGKPGEGLWIGTSGSQVCTATVDYAEQAFAADARKIGETVKPAR